MPRVISGLAKGTQLKTLDGNDTRPTSDRAKEAIFSILMGKSDGAKVLDLCAGSGQLGIEALSRRADFAVFVEQSKQASKVIQENLKKTKFEASSKIYTMPLERAILQLEKESFDMIFFDPPYKDANRLLERYHTTINSLLSEEGVFIVEQASKDFQEQEYRGLETIKHCKYGAAMVSFYKKNVSL